MIDPKTNSLYNKILSIFLGIVVVLFINKLFRKPRVVIIYEKKWNINLTHFPDGSITSVIVDEPPKFELLNRILTLDNH